MIKQDMAKSSSLPPIKELFSQSWNTFVASILPLFLFSIVLIVITLGFFVFSAGIILFLTSATGLFQLFSHMGIAAFAVMTLPLYLLSGVCLLVIIAGMIIISSLANIVTVQIVASYPKKISIGNTIKSGLGLVMPLFVTGLLAGIINFGGLFFFFLPAIVFSFFFMFVSYEVILEKKKLLSAIRRSVFIVSKSFGEILVRIFAFILLYILVVVFIPNFVMRIEPHTGIIITLLSVVTNTLMGWLGLCFFVTLYKQAKDGLGNGKEVSLLWIGIVSLLGWVIFAVLIYSGIKFLSSDAAKALLNNIGNEMKSSDSLNLPLQKGNPYNPPNGLQEL